MSGERAEAMREANDIIRDQVEGRVGLDERIAFLCECGEGDCYRAVWLTRADYDELRADSTQALLAVAHETELVAVLA